MVARARRGFVTGVDPPRIIKQKQLIRRRTIFLGCDDNRGRAITMRIKFVRTLLVLALVGNIIVWHKIWWLFTVHQTGVVVKPGITSIATSELPTKLHRRLARLVTIIIRQFETFENDVSSTVDSILNSFPAIPILIVCNELPYPPLEIDFANESLRNVKLINLQPDFNKSFEERNPLFYVRTKFVLFLPDATRLSTKQVMQVSIIYVYVSYKILNV